MTTFNVTWTCTISEWLAFTCPSREISCLDTDSNVTLCSPNITVWSEENGLTWPKNRLMPGGCASTTSTT